jgi:hypothetical protein
MAMQKSTCKKGALTPYLTGASFVSGSEFSCVRPLYQGAETVSSEQSEQIFAFQLAVKPAARSLRNPYMV